jgi:lysophospholipase L1-like esterase
MTIVSSMIWGSVVGAIVVVVVERWINYLPGGQRRHQSIRIVPLVIVLMSLVMALAVSLHTVYALLGLAGLLVGAVSIAIITVGATIVEAGLRSGGVRPKLDLVMWEIPFKDWKDQEALRWESYATVNFYLQYLHHYRNHKPTKLDGILYATGVETGDIAVQSGLRMTTDSPTSPMRRVCAFGGSTTFCAEVPNELTWCSQLQRRLGGPGSEIAVENHGISGTTITSLLPRIERACLGPGDVAVLYLGINEVAHLLLESTTRSPLPRPVCNAVRGVVHQFAQRSSLALWLEHAVFREEYSCNASAMDPIVGALREVYAQAATARFKVVLILQPWIADRCMRSTGDERILAKCSKDYVCSFSHGMAALRELLSTRFPVIDGSGLFSDVSVTPFIDPFHVNSRGNEVVARLVASKLPI